eukprot:scaffold115736_cov60-Attheya_sp.AAC.3
MSTLRRLSISRAAVNNAHLGLKNVRSETLEEINVIGMGKHCWCEGVVCPSLKLFRCSGGRFGNGIRQQFPERFNLENINVTGTKRASEFSCEGVHVPDSYAEMHTSLHYPVA